MTALPGSSVVDSTLGTAHAPAASCAFPLTRSFTSGNLAPFAIIFEKARIPFVRNIGRVVIAHWTGNSKSTTLATLDEPNSKDDRITLQILE